MLKLCLLLALVALVHGRCGLSGGARIRSCNDMEMFSQCSRAQQYLDEFNKDQGYSFATIECSDNIVCADYNNLDSAYWCQNMDAYNICKSVQRILENFTKYVVLPAVPKGGALATRSNRLAGIL